MDNIEKKNESSCSGCVGAIVILALVAFFFRGCFGCDVGIGGCNNNLDSLTALSVLDSFMYYRYKDSDSAAYYLTPGIRERGVVAFKDIGSEAGKFVGYKLANPPYVVNQGYPDEYHEFNVIAQYEKATRHENFYVCYWYEECRIEINSWMGNYLPRDSIDKR